MSIIRKPFDIINTFLGLTKNLPDRFERSRTWSPSSIMTWLLLITTPDRKTSYRRSLRLLTFYGRRTFGWTKVPTLSSLSTARRKLSIDMCRTFLHGIVQTCEAIMPRGHKDYGDRRFIAFDGSRMITPHTKDTTAKLHRFSKPGGGKSHNPQGLLVAAVDVFRRLPLDWIFVGKGVGERTAMTELIDRMELGPGDVAVMDRGFPSRKLFGALIEKGVDIIARMSTSSSGWKEVQAFAKKGKKNGIIELKVQGSDGPVMVRARLVERDRKRGRPRSGTKPERMVIITTLREEDGFDRQALIKLYGARWGIETLYGEMKAFMEVESFHSGFVDGCEQEIAAAMIWMALGSFLQAQAEATLNGRRVVRADCLRAASDLLAAALRGEDLNPLIDEDIKALRKFSVLEQPGRHYPRECKRPSGRTIQRGRAK